MEARTMEPGTMDAGTRTAPAECGGSTLVVKGLQKSYGKRLVVRDVSLQVACGEVVGLLGPNGAGKTTSFYMIVGLVPSDAGSIDINGTDITSLPIHRRALLGLSYLPQEASVFRKLTVEENIRAVLELQRENGKPLTKARIAAWRSRARSRPIRASCCWTSRSRAWIRLP
jgi:lipopolysaccharide export system ATP-binding protein